MQSSRSYLVFLLIIVLQIFCPDDIWGKATVDDKRAIIAMRTIGHQLLQLSGDSTSQVLPVLVEGGTYKISFASPFSFDPAQVFETTEEVLGQSNLTTAYIVEIKEQDSKAVVHSFESILSESDKKLVCGGRRYPKKMYDIHITFTQARQNHHRTAPQQAKSTFLHAQLNQLNVSNYVLWLLLLALPVLLYLLIRWLRVHHNTSDVIQIGRAQLNVKNMEFKANNTKQILSSKEAALLITLHKSANEVVTRQDLLREVWSDEGSYVGRTLDVFISKLRKKIEADPNLQIKTVRGVGYELVLM